MTKLTDEGIKALEEVAATRLRIAPRMAEVENAYAIDKFDAEAPLRQAVLLAREAGVPIRQIGLQGLGTKDFRTVRALLPDDETQEVAAPVIKPGKVLFNKKTDNEFEIVDAHGRVWGFWTMDFDGTLSVDRINEGYPETGELPVPFDVLQAVKKHYPKALLDESLGAE